jgi:hypothetical protein
MNERAPQLGAGPAGVNRPLTRPPVRYGLGVAVTAAAASTNPSPESKS